MEMHPRNRTRSEQASLLAEAPVTVWLLFIVLVFPLLILGSLTYRIVFLDFAVRDSCAVAARADSFSIGQDAAQEVFKTDLSHFTGVNAKEEILIFIKPLSGEAGWTE